MNAAKKLINIVMKYREVISYIFFGVLSTMANFGTYFVLSKVFHVNYLISNVMAWGVAVVFAFITNKIFVFESKGMGFQVLIKEGVSFVGFRLLSGAMDMVMMYVGVEWLLCSDGVVKIVANILVIVVNYIASKLVIFKGKG